MARNQRRVLCETLCLVFASGFLLWSLQGSDIDTNVYPQASPRLPASSNAVGDPPVSSSSSESLPAHTQTTQPPAAVQHTHATRPSQLVSAPPANSASSAAAVPCSMPCTRDIALAPGGMTVGGRIALSLTLDTESRQRAVVNLVKASPG